MAHEDKTFQIFGMEIQPDNPDLTEEELEKLKGLMLYQSMLFKASFIPFVKDLMEMNRIELSVDPEAKVSEWALRAKSALNFSTFIETLGLQLFSSAVYPGEQLLAENEFFKLNFIPARGKPLRALFHIGGYIPYSDNIFRLLPERNFFDHFIKNGISVYEMKCKCDKKNYNPGLLKLKLDHIIETIHHFSDIAFEHNSHQKMILEGYCGTGINTYTSYLADRENMDKKFSLITTFVSPVDGRKCNIFTEMFNVLNSLHIFSAFDVDGYSLSTALDVVQERVFEKTPLGAMTHGWKNKEYANIEKIEDLNSFQRSELAAWYWISLKHGSYYPISADLYRFYLRLFRKGIGKDGVIPHKYHGKILNIKDLKETGIKVVIFLGEKDNLVAPKTADIMETLLGEQCVKIIHEKTGHVAYIFNPERWESNNKRAFQPGIIETLLKYSE